MSHYAIRALIMYGCLLSIGVAFALRRTHHSRWADYIPVVTPLVAVILLGFFQ